MRGSPPVTAATKAAIVKRYTTERNHRVLDICSELKVSPTTVYNVMREAGELLRYDRGDAPFARSEYEKPKARFSSPDRQEAEDWLRGHHGLTPTGPSAWGHADGRVGVMQYAMDAWHCWIVGP